MFIILEFYQALINTIENILKKCSQKFHFISFYINEFWQRVTFVITTYSNFFQPNNEISN